MRTRVTAVVVAHQGGEWLDQTIAGLQAQTRRPDRVIAVSNGAPPRVAEQLAEGADLVVSTASRLPFSAAVKQAIAAIPAEGLGGDSASDADGAGSTAAERAGSDWIWLLPEDACPEPEALDRILSTVQRAPSVAVAGPKLVDWDRPERIIELGQSLTQYGERWKLRRQELDQQQYDDMQDVLGVGPVGMLVRRDVWDQLGGFDPALPVFDDGLDFCVRARLAGYRVEVAPASRVRFAESGVAGPRIDRRRSVMRAAHRQARTSHLHRRIAYAPAPLAFLMWLGLPLLAVLRVFWALIREQPGQMLGEFTSAMRVFFRPAALIASRRRIKAHSGAGWAAVRPLRVDPKAVRTARMIDREAILAAQGREPKEMHFISMGGLGVLIGAVVIAVALCWWVLAHTSLTGGALAPLSSLGELWGNTRTIDGVPADPFTWVLAVLGTLTFWNPSHAIVLFYLVSIPLAALGGWIWAAQITDTRSGRVLLGIGWAISPVLLGSLDSGRFPTLVLAVVLPWLLLAATRCRESWSWAGTASLLAAVALACAPILIPAGLILLVVGAFSSVRGAARVLTTAIAPLVLFGPKIVQSFLSGRPVDLLLDPGLTPAYVPGSTWHLMLGFPEFGLEGWAGILADLGLGGPPATLLVGVLLLPIGLLALVGLFTGRVPVTVLLTLFGGLGMLTALSASQMHLLLEGAESVPLWTGSGLTLYWLAILSLGAVGCEALRRVSPGFVTAALLTAAVAVTPLGTQLVTASTGITAGTAQLPAIVQAAGTENSRVRTLELTAEAPHEVRAQLISGTGLRLDQLRTAGREPQPTEADQELAELVGGLASAGGAQLDEQLEAQLRGQHVEFVLLNPTGDPQERIQLQSVFDQHTSLVSAGQTAHGLLWRVQLEGGQTTATEDAEASLSGTSFSSRTIWWVQLLVLLGIVLLALPTGEVVERPEKRKRPSRRKKPGGSRGRKLPDVRGGGDPEALEEPDEARERGEDGDAGAVGAVEDRGAEEREDLEGPREAVEPRESEEPREAEELDASPEPENPRETPGADRRDDGAENGGAR